MCSPQPPLLTFCPCETYDKIYKIIYNLCINNLNENMKCLYEYFFENYNIRKNLVKKLNIIESEGYIHNDDDTMAILLAKMQEMQDLFSKIMGKKKDA